MDILAGFPASVAALTLEWRRQLHAGYPDWSERPYPGWKALGWVHPRAGYLLGLFPQPGSLRLIFEWGALLRDPKGLLKNGGRQVRYLEVTGAGVQPIAAVREFLRQSVALPPRRAERLALLAAMEADSARVGEPPPAPPKPAKPRSTAAKRASGFDRALAEARACTLCAAYLPLGPRPVLQLSESVRILVIGQAPGAKVHASGIPWDDASGRRLREWMGLDEAVFYDASRVGLLPMGFCYPGKAGGGDAPPRPECAPAWHGRLLASCRELRLTVLIGRYALSAYGPTAALPFEAQAGAAKTQGAPGNAGKRSSGGGTGAQMRGKAAPSPADSVTELLKNFGAFGQERMPLVHPSPRNGIWLRKHPWFERDLVPELRRRVQRALEG